MAKCVTLTGSAVKGLSYVHATKDLQTHQFWWQCDCRCSTRHGDERSASPLCRANDDRSWKHSRERDVGLHQSVNRVSCLNVQNVRRVTSRDRTATWRRKHDHIHCGWQQIRQSSDIVSRAQPPLQNSRCLLGYVQFSMCIPLPYRHVSTLTREKNVNRSKP